MENSNKSKPDEETSASKTIVVSQQNGDQAVRVVILYLYGKKSSLLGSVGSTTRFAVTLAYY